MSPSDERAALTKRLIPHMVLSNGSPSSLTAVPQTPTTAQERFTVHGNVLVTGGAGALGLSTCSALLEHSCSGLMILDVNTSAATDSIASLKARFPHARILTATVDVTDEASVTTAITHAAAELGSIDALVHLVGIVGCHESLSMPVTTWRRILDVNTTGAFLCAQAVAKQMVAQGTGGSITLIASISGHRVNFPQPQAAYNVSKAALLTLKSCLAAEWARYGIRTNTVSPGYLDTVLNEGEGIAEARRVWAERNPFGRMGGTGEVVGAIVLLASRAGSYINGADIVVDGGAIVF